MTTVPQAFAQRKATILGKLAVSVDDRSPKGSVDAALLPLLDVVNAMGEYVSTSCCSGRVAVCAQGDGGANRWLLVSHEPIARATLHRVLHDAAAAAERDVKLMFEPFILAVECADLPAAIDLYQAGVAAGCRESGIQMSTPTSRILVTIRCSIRLEVPIAGDLPDAFVDHLAGVVDARFVSNTARIGAFAACFAERRGAAAATTKAAAGGRSRARLVCSAASTALVAEALRARGFLDMRISRRSMRSCLHVFDEGNVGDAVPARSIPISRDADRALRVCDSIGAALDLDDDVALALAYDDGDDDDGAAAAAAAASPIERLRALISVAASGSPALPRLLALAPRKWERLGDDLALLPAEAFVEPEWGVAFPDRDALWRGVAACLGVRRLGRQARIDASARRQSRVELLLGADGWVDHVENGVTYSFDVVASMFASGNGTERMRMGRIAAAADVVVDLFAGIGYFTLPMLLQARVRHVYACEWNAPTLVALRRNLDRIDPRRWTLCAGDNRELQLGAVADRVVLGLIPSSAMSWQVAIRVLKPSGGWLHVHANIDDDRVVEYEQEAIARLLQLAAATDCPRKQRWAIRVGHRETVKSYAPRITHYVLDIECSEAAAQTTFDPRSS